MQPENPYNFPLFIDRDLRFHRINEHDKMTPLYTLCGEGMGGSYRYITPHAGILIYFTEAQVEELPSNRMCTHCKIKSSLT